ncbi:hypothetical protein Tco_0828749 [Tanacetum coccineum]
MAMPYESAFSRSYTPTMVTYTVFLATEDSPKSSCHKTSFETVLNMTPVLTKLLWNLRKKSDSLILTEFGEMKIYSTVDACQTLKKCGEAIERLQQDTKRQSDSKPITPPFESASEEDSDLNKLRRT